MRRVLSSLIVLALVPAVLAQGQTTPAQPGTPGAVAAPTPATPAAPAQPATGTAGLYPRVKLETTLGNIVVELNGEKAPISTQNFMRYAQEGFYNGTIFHRVMSNFMIQGGGWTPDVVKKKDGVHPPIKNEWQNGLSNARGTIAMARTAEPDSATNEFFINVVDNTPGHPNDLDTPRPSKQGPAAYAVFGRVVEGMDVVDKIKDTPVQNHPKYPSQQPVVPVEPVIIKSVTLTGDYDAAKVEQAATEQTKKAEEERAKAEQEKAKALQDLATKLETEVGKKFEKTASGLMYAMTAEGQGDSPKPNQSVAVLYTASLPDGKVWDSATDRNNPHVRTLNARETLPGLLEALCLLKPGGKAKFILPPELAYGQNGRPDKGIPANSPVIFDIELINVQTPEQAKAAGDKQMQDFAAKTEAQTGKKFEKTASGLMYLKLTEGKGPAVGPTSKIKAHYTGWLLDGTKFDSSVDRAEPLPLDMSQPRVIKGWIEGLRMMRLGDKWKLLIPPDLAYGPAGRPPKIPANSPLVFDIEVVEVN